MNVHSLAALLATLALGCGVRNLDICRADCGARGRCQGTAQEGACLQACDRERSDLAARDGAEDQACGNAAALRAEKLDCYSRGCGEEALCAQPLARIDRSNPRCLP